MAYEIPVLDDSFEVATGKTIIQYRLVTLGSGGLAHTTGTPVLAVSLGVAQAGGTTASGRIVPVRLEGVTKVEASTAALARGVYISPTSGAASTGNTQLGGTVKASTAQLVAIGISLTSAAAAAAGNKRYVSVRLF